MEGVDAGVAVAGLLGGAGGFGGAFMAIKVHIWYITRDNARQDERLESLERAQAVTDRKADRAHVRIDHLEGRTA